MTVDVTPVFAAYLAGNRGPAVDDPTRRVPTAYGVSAKLDGSVIELALTFRAGAAYCCYEWGCHLWLFPSERWGRLRRELAAGGVPVPARLELRLKVVVEAGALFFNWARPVPGRPGVYELRPSETDRYHEVVITEASAPGAKQAAPPDRGGTR